MKSSHAVLSIAAVAALLSGCDHAPDAEEEAQYLQEATTKEYNTQQMNDATDLKQTLAELQKKDPTVKDVFFGVDEKGNKELHVVHEDEKDPQQYHESSFPMGGFISGYLMAQMFNNNGGYHNSYSNFASPSKSLTYREEDKKKNKSVVTSGYFSSIMTQSRGRVLSNPNYKANMTNAVTQSRSTGIFSRAGGARAATYGGGS